MICSWAQQSFRCHGSDLALSRDCVINLDGTLTHPADTVLSRKAFGIGFEAICMTPKRAG